MSTADVAVEAKTETPAARVIGDFAVELEWQQVPEETRARAKLLILDALGIAIAANRYPFAKSILTSMRDLASIDGTSGNSRVIGSGEKLPLRDAVLANGALVHGLDELGARDAALWGGLDDGAEGGDDDARRARKQGAALGGSHPGNVGPVV